CISGIIGSAAPSCPNAREQPELALVAAVARVQLVETLAAQVTERKLESVKRIGNGFILQFRLAQERQQFPAQSFQFVEILLGKGFEIHLIRTFSSSDWDSALRHCWFLRRASAFNDTCFFMLEPVM